MGTAGRRRLLLLSLTPLRQSEAALLKKQAEEKEREGRDLLEELATAVREQIEEAKREYELLSEAAAQEDC